MCQEQVKEPYMVREKFGEGLLPSTIIDTCMSRTGKGINAWSGEGLGKGFSPHLSLICQEQVKESLHGKGRVWGKASPLNYH